MTNKINLEKNKPLHICKIDVYKLLNDGGYHSEIRGEYFNKTGKHLEIKSYFGELWFHEEDDLKAGSMGDFEEEYGNDFVDTFNEIDPSDIEDKESFLYIYDAIMLYSLKGFGAVLKASDNL